jgi:hypothetical protein
MVGNFSLLFCCNTKHLGAYVMLTWIENSNLSLHIILLKGGNFIHQKTRSFTKDSSLRLFNRILHEKIKRNSF